MIVIGIDSAQNERSLQNSTHRKSQTTQITPDEFRYLFSWQCRTHSIQMILLEIMTNEQRYQQLCIRNQN